MELLLFLHNFLRWLVVSGIAVILILLFVNNLKTLGQEGNVSGKLVAAEWLKKFAFRYSLVVTIELLLGIALYLLSPSVLELWRNIPEMMKQKELRMIAVEHPAMMILFTGIAHMISARLRKLDTLKNLRIALLLSLLGTAILLYGIPWFRPLMRTL